MHCRIQPGGHLAKKKMFSGVADFYSFQLFMQEFQPTPYTVAVLPAISQFDSIPERGNAGLRNLTVIIHPFVRNDHFHLKRHGVNVIFSNPLEEMAQVSGPAAFTTDGHCRLNERLFRQSAQKHYGVKDI